MTNNEQLWLPARLDYLTEFDSTASRQLDQLYDDLNNTDIDIDEFRCHLDDLGRSLDDTARTVLMEW